MATLARRFVALSALGLWLGGFALYTAVVIRVGHRGVPGGRFGFVTADVMGSLNRIGAAAAVLLLANLAAERRSPGPWARRGAVVSWALLAAAQAALFVLHAKLGGVLDRAAHVVLESARFEDLHDAYELVATGQWLAGMAHLGCLLALWRGADRAHPA